VSGFPLDTPSAFRQGEGFSGLENPLFFKPVTGMLYGDAKDSLTKLVGAVQHA
jgi:proton-translocating NAD(P)+ transhydrogenase subunit beta